MTACSPDGALLATVPSTLGQSAGEATSEAEPAPKNMVFVDATGAGAAVPAPVPAGAAWWDRAVLGWRSSTHLLLSDSSAGVGATTFDLIVDVSLDNGEQEVISRFAVSAHSDYAIQQVQLATGLLADVAVRPAGDLDRGPWPIWARATATIVVGILLAILALVTRRFHARLSGGPASAGRVGSG